MNLCDALIVGGGPAGAAAAISLARAGCQVTVVERTRYSNVRVGETLPPAIKPVLHQLDAWEAFLDGSPVRSPGTVSAWGSRVAYENDFIVNPYGGGWHVDRGRFDAALMSVAQRFGVRSLFGEPVTTPKWERDRWTALVGPASSAQRIEARFVVDATGRNAAVAARLGSRKVFHDHLVAVVHFFQCDRSPSDTRTLVESDEHGWWYSAPLPDSRLVVAYMTDADLLPRTSGAVADYCKGLLRRVPHTWARLGGPREPAVVSTVPARTSLLIGSSANGTLAVGDAVATFDPLSSCGVSFALCSGMRAADAILGVMSGQTDSIARYAEWIGATFDEYLSNRSVYYARERRWPESPFWLRRYSRASALN